MKVIIDLLPRTQSKEAEGLDTNPGNSFVHEVVDKTVELRFITSICAFTTAAGTVVRDISALVNSSTLESLRSKVNPSAQAAYMLDATVASTFCSEPDQDFRLATSFTRGALRFVDYISPGILSEEMKNSVINGKGPIYSIFLPASSGEGGMSTYFGQKALNFPEPMPIIQGSSTVWHDSIKMFAGVTLDSVNNTIIKKKTRAITRSDSLVGFVMKSQLNDAVFTASYKGEEKEPEFPVDTDIIMEAPVATFKRVVDIISDRTRALESFAKVNPAEIQFSIVSDTLCQDYNLVGGNLVHKTSGTTLSGEKELVLIVKVNLKLVYVHRKKSSTAMFPEASSVWFKDIWPSSAVNKTNCSIAKGAKPFLGTKAADDRKKREVELEAKAQQQRKRAPTSSSAVDERDIEQGDAFLGETEPLIVRPLSPSSSSSSSSSFHNPLSDDII